MHRVVIVGGGFGGLVAAKSLRRSSVEITLVDRRNHHLFQPLLYQVATGALSPANIASPLRHVLRRQRNVRVLLAEVVGIDVAGRRLLLRQGELPYDTLILAAGSSHSYFGRDEWALQAPGLKSIEDATAIRRRILIAFEEAELSDDPERVTMLLTFVIVGGGPTGVEMAGAIAEIAHDTLRNEFRTINPADARVLLVESLDRVLPAYPPELSASALDALTHIGVEVHLGTRVTEIGEDFVMLQSGAYDERIAVRNVIWAAGVQASPLGCMLAETVGAQTDRAGRVHVGPDFSLPGHPEILVIGDMAYYPHLSGKPLPALAPVAMQQAEYVARLIDARLRNRKPPRPFRYKDFGTMATIGRLKAVADLRGWRFTGAVAWFVWLLVHLMQIVQFQNRLLVLIQWAWHYMTMNRGARLITGEDIERVQQAESADTSTVESVKKTA
jgi:NADH dehydrogenase